MLPVPGKRKRARQTRAAGIEPASPGDETPSCATVAPGASNCRSRSDSQSLWPSGRLESSVPESMKKVTELPSRTLSAITLAVFELSNDTPPMALFVIVVIRRCSHSKPVSTKNALPNSAGQKEVHGFRPRTSKTATARQDRTSRHQRPLLSHAESLTGHCGCANHQ
jgi:hypothetical protein